MRLWLLLVVFFSNFSLQCLYYFLVLLDKTYYFFFITIEICIAFPNNIFNCCSNSLQKLY